MAKLGGVVAGSTEPLICTLLEAGVPFPIPPGFTVEIKLRNGAFVRVDTDEEQTEIVEDQEENPGQVRFTPAAEDFVHNTDTLPPEAERYPCRFKVTDGNGVVKYFPREGWDYIEVYRE